MDEADGACKQEGLVDEVDGDVRSLLKLHLLTGRIRQILLNERIG